MQNTLRLWPKAKQTKYAIPQQTIGSLAKLKEASTSVHEQLPGNSLFGDFKFG